MNKETFFIKQKFYCLLAAICLTLPKGLLSQTISESDTLLQSGTLQNCIQYALFHQPLIQQSILDEEITERSVKSRLADWFPQINFNYNLQHNYQLPVSIIQGNTVQLGLKNTSSGQFSVTQTIFNRDVLLASSTANDLIEQSRQRTISNKISIVVNVSKAFYAVLLVLQQNQLLNDDIIRLNRSLEDAHNQYKAGVVDKTDYERASISLNNAKAEKRQAEESLKTSYSFLKEQMGYPADSRINLAYDSTKMETEAFIDTNQTINYENRIEYQLLQSQREILRANILYNDWGFLPSLHAFGNYNLNYQNDVFSKLYERMYPNSFIGLTLTFPIFEGGRRYQDIKIARLELTRSDYDISSFRNTANTQYIQALGSYKSNLNNYYILKQNLELARDVYNTIELQYRAGVKTYLDVITAETDLRTTQINYINALFQVLSSKLDVQRALGIIKY